MHPTSAPDVADVATSHVHVSDGATACGVTRHAPISQRLRERYARDFKNRFDQEWGGKMITHGQWRGANVVRLDGNDYLGIANHPDIVRAQIAALRSDQHSMVQSGAFQSDASPSGTLEAALAGFVGHEGAMLCQSGYAANLGLLQVIADADTPVYIDSLAHMSLWEGVRAAGATAQAFRHNDPAHLQRLIARTGPGVVVVDSVYSTTGALCPLREMVEVAEAGQCMIVVDESHSLGTHGPQGRGLCAQLGLSHRVHFISASLAKAFAGRAGFFTLPRELQYFAVVTAFPSLFSSCLLPHEIAGLSATLELIRRSDDARERLASHTRGLRESLASLGYPIAQGTEQIIALEAGPETETLRLRQALEQRGVVGAVFAAPATARNRSMVRLTLSASLTQAEVEHVQAVAREVAPVLKPWDWPAARRQRVAA